MTTRYHAIAAGLSFFALFAVADTAEAFSSNVTFCNHTGQHADVAWGIRCPRDLRDHIARMEEGRELHLHQPLQRGNPGDRILVSGGKVRLIRGTLERYRTALC